MSEGLIQQSINGTDTSDANASSSQLLSGASAYVKGNKINGSMPNRESWGTSISPGSSVIIPNGYHNGSGSIRANAGLNTNDATATSDQILSGASAYVKGSKINGSMTNRGTWSTSISPGGSITIPSGFHNGNGVISAEASTGHRVSTGTFGCASNGYIGSSVSISCGFTPSMVVVAMTSSSVYMSNTVAICGASNNGAVAYNANGNPSFTASSGGVYIDNGGFTFGSGSRMKLHQAYYTYIAID